MHAAGHIEHTAPSSSWNAPHGNAHSTAIRLPSDLCSQRAPRRSSSFIILQHLFSGANGMTLLQNV